MSIPYWWWLIAAALAIAEMFTGTFYLLIVALGCAAAGLAAFLGMGLTAQLLIAAAVMVVGFFALRAAGLGRVKPVEPDRNPDVNLDVGGSVSVQRWDSARETRVKYRGAMWTVRLADEITDTARPGEFRIDRVQGNTLVVTPSR